jgi:hypothetical protein
MELTIKGKNCWHSAKADNNPPATICGCLAIVIAIAYVLCLSKDFTKRSCHDETNNSGEELTDPLHGEDSCHHCATPPCRGKL